MSPAGLSAFWQRTKDELKTTPVNAHALHWLRRSLGA